MFIGFFFFNLFIYYLWVCWVFVSVRGLSPVVASGGHSSSRCAGLSLSRPLLLRSTGSRRAGSVTAAHGPSCSAAYGIFPDRDSNPCSLQWQADSQPLHHQGSPMFIGFLFALFVCFWPHQVACRILVPPPGIKPRPLAVIAQSPNHWNAREFPLIYVIPFLLVTLGFICSSLSLYLSSLRYEVRLFEIFLVSSDGHILLWSSLSELLLLQPISFGMLYFHFH